MAYRIGYQVPGVLAALLVSAGAVGQGCTPPVNEECEGAIEFAFVDLPFTFSDVLGCTNDMVDRPYFDVFFVYECTRTGNYTFDMCDSTGDSYMRVYVDGCGFGPATSWVEDDDGCGAFPGALDPRITMPLSAGTTYYIEAGARRPERVFPPNANDDYTFNAVFEPTPCPGDCAGRPDGVVDVEDLVALLTHWGEAGECDTDDSGVIDVSDLLELLIAWGACD